jgi:retinol dehydrogenase 12
VTGGNAGVGRELSRILYGANATVYLACRSESKARQAIKEMQQAAPDSKGRLEVVVLDLSDLTTIKPAVESFLSRENKLHVLFNNAGVMIPPEGQKTAQGYDMQLGTNCVGPFLLTQLLTPMLVQTAKTEPANTVRVVWLSSMAADLYSPKHGVDMSNIRGKDFIKKGAPMQTYAISKAGNCLYAIEYSRRHKSDGIVSVVSTTNQ